MWSRSTKQRRAAMFRRGQYRIAADNPNAHWSRWSDGRLYATVPIDHVKLEASLRQRFAGGMDALVYRPHPFAYVGHYINAPLVLLTPPKEQ